MSTENLDMLDFNRSFDSVYYFIALWPNLRCTVCFCNSSSINKSIYDIFMIFTFLDFQGILFEATWVRRKVKRVQGRKERKERNPKNLR